MDRSDLLRMIREHPAWVHGDAEQLLARCEAEVKRHANEDAWMHAKKIIDLRRELFENSWGFHASEAFVGQELCHELAQQMRTEEPVVRDGDEEHLAGRAVLDAFEPEARDEVLRFVHELAQEIEHRTWQEILRFTDRRGIELVREGRLSTELEWDKTRSYADSAAKVTAILASEFERRAHAKA